MELKFLCLMKMKMSKRIKEFKKYSKEITKNKESAKNFLVKVGILTKDEKLSKNYGGF